MIRKANLLLITPDSRQTGFQCLSCLSSSQFAWKRQIFLGIFYQIQKETNYEKVNCNISYILILETGK